ncbi:hypothetical protein ONA91_05640 [Micromonospora sp. DR5-3]|uniref:hypothetical protein n=1 Tax=unclassified Micromonospora TaxID=2617518 RepID=UPI0011D9E9B3|nr:MULTISPECIES: hypothetical protein [unclassified Micromonospora]MCW3813937.1 hypothetical protein [Micromonospora sp. DR5-3]TYC24524.1 hypothetical protein FXF52_09650 [Micromonospora sp. MP36]
MTTQKSFKTRVRARMAKTGESYTTARRQLLAKATTDAPATTRAGTPETAPAAGGRGQRDRISDALLRERTGRDWDAWFRLLDEWSAADHGHTEIARWLVTAHDVPGWWAQTITVGYEQARGLREPGQRRGGGFEATGSRTVAVPVAVLFAAFADETVRGRWLPDVPVRVRTATAPKTFRADWADGPTRIAVGFTPVGEAKARVAVLHEKLADADEADRLRAYWRDRLAALKQLLESPEEAR